MCIKTNQFTSFRQLIECLIAAIFPLWFNVQLVCACNIFSFLSSSLAIVAHCLSLGNFFLSATTHCSNFYCVRFICFDGFFFPIDIGYLFDWKQKQNEAIIFCQKPSIKSIELIWAIFANSIDFVLKYGENNQVSTHQLINW